MICNKCRTEVGENWLIFRKGELPICTNCALDALTPQWLKFLEWPTKNEMKDFENTIWLTKNQGRLYECSGQRLDLEDGG